MAKANQIFYTSNVSLYTSMTDYEGARYATAQAAENLYGSLRPGGYLFLGGAKTTRNLDDNFERIPLERAGGYGLGQSSQRSAE